MTTLERRYQTVDGLETRTEGNQFRFVGHVAKFNTWSQDLGGFRERLRAGVFAKTVKEADIRFLFNHDPNFVIGRNRSKTATIEEDSVGLFVDGLAPDTQWARDLHETVGRGDVDQGSFGFRKIRDEWNDQRTERDMLEASLFDVSLVTFPAYQDTDLSARSTFFVQGLAQSLRSGAELNEETIAELRRLLEPVAPVKDHPTEEDPSSRDYLTDLDIQIRRYRAAA